MAPENSQCHPLASTGKGTCFHTKEVLELGMAGVYFNTLELKARGESWKEGRYCFRR